MLLINLFISLEQLMIIGCSSLMNFMTSQNMLHYTFGVCYNQKAEI